MELSLGITTSMPTQQSVKYAQHAEEAGYHRVWVGEDITSREIFTYLTMIALRTETIEIGCGITNPYTRKITTIASSVAGVQHLSGGRFTLGLGTGGIPEVEKITGRAPHDVVDVMWEATAVLKSIFYGEAVSHEGVVICLNDYILNHPEMRPLDIYFGVRGPKLMALAGEMADGVIFSGPLDYLAHSMEIVDDAARSKGRTLRSIRKVLWNAFVLGDTESDMKAARPMAATMIASLPEAALDDIALDRETLEDVRSLFSASRYDEAYALVDNEIIREFMIAGSKAEIEDQMAGIEKMGFDEIIVGPPFGSEPLDVIEQMGINLGGGA